MSAPHVRKQIRRIRLYASPYHYSYQMFQIKPHSQISSKPMPVTWTVFTHSFFHSPGNQTLHCPGSSFLPTNPAPRTSVSEVSSASAFCPNFFSRTSTSSFLFCFLKSYTERCSSFVPSYMKCEIAQSSRNVIGTKQYPHEMWWKRENTLMKCVKCSGSSIFLMLKYSDK